MSNKFYITTPIYYVNDVPHAGHAYTNVAADVLARYWKARLGEENVFFLTGTDEHGAKVAAAASQAGQTPQAFVDTVVPQFQRVWKDLNIEYDHFFRTTDSRHEKEVCNILQRLYDGGYIYEGIYEGLYCEGCEKFLITDDLVDNKCPLHPNKELQHQKEKNYFFKLSSFKEDLIKVFNSNDVCILPDNRKNEILGKLAGELRDVSISRAEVLWGIPIPWDKTQTIYVWFEALLNYYTATRFLEGKEKFWPADLHLIGKDILWFHTVIWCAMLMAASLPHPKVVFAHGFFTINGQKMSKSLGNVISPGELIEKFGTDASRYLLLSEFSFGQDGDFSFDKLTNRYNAELANGLGNLVSRVAKLCQNNNIIIKTYEGGFDDRIAKPFLDYDFNMVLSHINSEVSEANRLINETKPWDMVEGGANAVLEDLARKIQHIAFNFGPFMPETSEKILKQFTGKIKVSEPLFPRI